MQKVTVRAGQTVRFDVDVKGEPAPTTAWFFKTVELKTGASSKVDHEPYNTKIAISDTTRANTGTYILKAENASGKDEAEVEVIILGKFFYDSDISFWYNRHINYQPSGKSGTEQKDELTCFLVTLYVRKLREWAEFYSILWCIKLTPPLFPEKMHSILQ